MSAAAPPPNHHGTAFLFAGTGVFVRGPPRSGKSALAFSALRRAELLGAPAFLVADDQVLLSVENERLVARPPPAIAGRIEVSGVGILTERFVGEAAIGLLVDLAERREMERLPEAETGTLLGIKLRRIVLPAREAAFGADVIQRLAPGAVTTALTKS